MSRTTGAGVAGEGVAVARGDLERPPGRPPPSQKASRSPAPVATTAGMRKPAYPSCPARKGTLVSVIGGFLRSFDGGTGDRSAYPGRANAG